MVALHYTRRQCFDARAGLPTASSQRHAYAPALSPGAQQQQQQLQLNLNTWSGLPLSSANGSIWSASPTPRYGLRVLFAHPGVPSGLTAADPIYNSGMLILNVFWPSSCKPHLQQRLALYECVRITICRGLEAKRA